MTGRSLPLALGALALLALTACGADGAAMSVSAEALADGAAAPPSSIRTDPEPADPPGPEDSTVDAVRPRFPNPAWPPVTLAPGEPPVMPASVNVIGDSIALSAQPIVTATLESLGIEILAYDAVESRRMVSGSSSLPSGASAIEDALASGAVPELWIVALGTNDVGAMSNADALRGDVDRILGLVPENAHLIWIDTWLRDFEQPAAGFNSMVREALSDRPYTTVLDWHRHAGVDDDLIISDGVHLSDVGKVEYARMIGDALRELFDRS